MYLSISWAVYNSFYFVLFILFSLCHCIEMSEVWVCLIQSDCVITSYGLDVRVYVFNIAHCTFACSCSRLLVSWLVSLYVCAFCLFVCVCVCMCVGLSMHNGHSIEQWEIWTAAAAAAVACEHIYYIWDWKWEKNTQIS